ncbi:MAG: hypothetical protein K6E91_04375 [Butyrivibrio sp.]|nr:hypothetical protein [Butyrivibrio sp.]
MEKIKKIIKECPIIIGVGAGALLLTVTAFALKDSTYATYAEETDESKAPVLAVALKGAQDGVFPWTQETADSEMAEYASQGDDVIGEVSMVSGGIAEGSGGGAGKSDGADQGQNGGLGGNGAAQGQNGGLGENGAAQGQNPDSGKGNNTDLSQASDNEKSDGTGNSQTGDSVKSEDASKNQASGDGSENEDGGREVAFAEADQTAGGNQAAAEGQKAAGADGMKSSGEDQTAGDRNLAGAAGQTTAEGREVAFVEAGQTSAEGQDSAAADGKEAVAADGKVSAAADQAETDGQKAADAGTATEGPAVAGASGQEPQVTDTVAQSAAKPVVIPVVEDRVYNFTSVNDDYFSDALFIGDSRTVGLSEYCAPLDERATFYAKISMSIYDVMKKKFISSPNGKIGLEQALSENNFGKIYIMLGLNEIGTGTDEYFRDAYKGVIDRIRQLQPGAIIYIQGIMHVTGAKSAGEKYFNNERINSRNAAISTLADQKYVFYMDMNPVVDDENGNLQADISFDGVHLKASAYQKWYEFLLQHAIVR